MNGIIRLLLGGVRYVSDRWFRGASRMTVSAESHRLVLAGRWQGRVRVALIDAMFCPGHCARDHARITAGGPQVLTMRERVAAVLVPVLLLVPFAGLAWWVMR